MSKKFRNFRVKYNMSKKFRNFRVKYQESSIGFENLAYHQSIENKCKHISYILLKGLPEGNTNGSSHSVNFYDQNTIILRNQILQVSAH